MLFYPSLSVMLVLKLTSILIIQCGEASSKSHILSFEVGPTIRNCQDVLRQDNKTKSSGIYTVYPYHCCPERPVKVYCDMETDGGGWTVIQRRDDIEPREDFYRTWMEYALGFGDLNGEFWLGLDNIHTLTDQTLNELRFDLTDFEGNSRSAEFRFFYVHDRSLNYKMEVNGYTGDAEDSFSYHNGHPFSTKDKDPKNCATTFKGGWWYNKCHKSNLNGLYLSGNHTAFATGINWQHWKGHHYSLKKTEMKIRPAN